MKIKLVYSREYPELDRFRKEFEISKSAEICVAVGGDGTFVRAAKSHDGPILPIRSDEPGSMGYYSDVSLRDMDFVIRALKERRFSIERLENKMEISYKGRRYRAVNEALLHNRIEEVSFKIYEIKNGKRVDVYPYVMSGDGVLVTGAIGSTAYNKSAGGPIILSPNVICLTFLNVDGPYRNPIIIDASKTLEIEVVKYTGVLRYDGTEIASLRKGDSFRVGISGKELKIIRFRGRSEGLAEKLERIVKSRMVK